MEDMDRDRRHLEFVQQGVQASFGDIGSELVGQQTGYSSALQDGLGDAVIGIHAEARFDGNRNMFAVFPKPPFRGAAHGERLDLAAVRELFGMAGCTMVFDICGRGEYAVAHRADAPRHLRGIGQLADADSDVQAFIHQVHHPVDKQRLAGDFGMAR